MREILIKNGTVIDGTGRKAYKADVLLKDDIIEAIEPEIPAKKGWKIIDAAGKVVCPGIIDPHSHADLTIYREDHPELLEPLIRQGVTTFIGGNCGMSMAPLNGTHSEQIKMYVEGFTAREFDEEVTWKDTAGFIEHLEKNGTVMNCALLAPHGVIRIDAMGMASRHATDDEIRKMCRTLHSSMEAGCIGMSTGLQYMPGLQCDTHELVRLGAVLSLHGGIYASHLRTYMNEIDKAVDELVTVCRTNGIRGQVSHIFWVPDLGPMGPIIRAGARQLINLSRYWTLPLKMDGEIENQINKLVDLRKRGIDIGMDVMPTTTTFTHLLAYFPPWVLQGRLEDIRKRLTTPRIRRKIRHDIETGRMIWPHTGRNSWSLNIFKILGWECTRIMSVVTEKNKPLEGRAMADIAAERGCHPFDAACDILHEEGGRVLVFSSLGEPEDSFTEQSIFAALSHPNVSISTDTVLMGIGRPSHLFYGAYPKFFSRYVREKKMLDLETAVRKVTGLPAEHFGLKKRGAIKKGHYADVLVFDPDEITPNCSFTNPRGVPGGISHVFINGSHMVERGNFNRKVLPGRVLKKS